MSRRTDLQKLRRADLAILLVSRLEVHYRRRGTPNRNQRMRLLAEAKEKLPLPQQGFALKIVRGAGRSKKPIAKDPLLIEAERRMHQNEDANLLPFTDIDVLTESEVAAVILAQIIALRTEEKSTDIYERVVLESIFSLLPTPADPRSYACPPIP